MTAGRLSKRIVIERATETPDGSGGFSTSWTALATRWAETRPVRGREEREIGQTAATKTWLFIVRKDAVTSTVTHKDRVRWDGAVFDIVSARRGLPDGKNLNAFMTVEAETALGAS